MMNSSHERCHGSANLEGPTCPACGASAKTVELPPLARLTAEEQVFVETFVRVRGSVRRMERLLGIDDPMVNDRLKAIAAKLDHGLAGRHPSSEIVEALKRGEIGIQPNLIA